MERDPLTAIAVKVTEPERTSDSVGVFCYPFVGLEM